MTSGCRLPAELDQLQKVDLLTPLKLLTYPTAAKACPALCFGRTDESKAHLIHSPWKRTGRGRDEPLRKRTREGRISAGISRCCTSFVFLSPRRVSHSLLPHQPGIIKRLVRIVQIGMLESIKNERPVECFTGMQLETLSSRYLDALPDSQSPTTSRVQNNNLSFSLITLRESRFYFLTLFARLFPPASWF